MQLLTVPARPAMTPPIYAIKKVGDLDAGTIYLRKGAEVLTAKGVDIPFLYGERSTAFSEVDDIDVTVPSSLPPSPATIQEFVGRFASIERVITWLKTSRDPRLFLWGQGGSGKSTIAYECASLVAQAGSALVNRFGKKIDRVIYISGKATYLDPHSGKIKNISSRDFDNALDVFKAILVLSEWTAPEMIDEYSYDEALEELEQLFEIETQLIIIDDIDTLTTSNKDGGMEELFLTLSRAKSGTKVLYTQRGFPSFAPNAAVEVPGLNEAELRQFVTLCCKKFSVENPEEQDLLWISEHSEQRPLAIETIIGMRRITSSYGDAFRRWKENSSEARVYLFNREYQQLSKEDRGRHLLAALSTFGTAQSFATLRDVLKFSVEQLEDAISETRDMFLTVKPGSKRDGDQYSIGAATRLFIAETSQQLDRYASIEARVNHFKTQSQSIPPAFIPLINRAKHNVEAGNPSDAIALLTKTDLPPAFKEYPVVQALLGQAYATLTPPNVLDARACFESAYTLGYKNYQMYIAWLNLEKVNRTELLNGISICKRVVNNEGFDSRTRATFHKRLARYQVLRANEIDLTSPEESSALRSESVVNNASAFFLARSTQDPALLSYRERVEDSINILLRRSLKVDDFDSFFGLIERMMDLQSSIGEFSDAISGRISEILSRPLAHPRKVIAPLNRMIGKLRSSDSKNLTKDEKEKILTIATQTLNAVREKQKEPTSY